MVWVVQDLFVYFLQQIEIVLNLDPLYVFVVIFEQNSVPLAKIGVSRQVFHLFTIEVEERHKFTVLNSLKLFEPLQLLVIRQNRVHCAHNLSETFQRKNLVDILREALLSTFKRINLIFHNINLAVLSRNCQQLLRFEYLMELAKVLDDSRKICGLVLDIIYV